jgi:hypothetical protein
VNWTPASRNAALIAGAIVCLLMGMLVGVIATGGGKHEILQAITHPASPSPRIQSTPSSDTLDPTTPAETVTTTATTTKTQTTPAPPARTITVTEPPTTVTVTDTTTTPPTTSTTGP